MRKVENRILGKQNTGKERLKTVGWQDLKRLKRRNVCYIQRITSNKGKKEENNGSEVCMMCARQISSRHPSEGPQGSQEQFNEFKEFLLEFQELLALILQLLRDS